MIDPLSQFREALSVAGVSCAAPIVPDGKIHRYRAADDKAANSWYVVFQENGFAAGSFGCWKRNFSKKWSAIREHALTPEQNASMRKHWREAEAVREAEERKRHAEAALNARDLIAEGGPVEEHPYLEKKNVRAYGDMVLNYSELILPLRDAAGNLHSAQRIDESGEKRFLFGGRVDGCFYSILTRPTGPIVICEGYATGASIAEATGFATVAAMNCGNLKPVYEALRALHPSRFIILAADDDRWTSGNPGLTKAREIRETAKDPLLFICKPVFVDLETKPTDFNDMAAIHGLEFVTDCFRAGFPQAVRRLRSFECPKPGDPSELIKNRWLCRGKGAMLIGPTGAGKSSLLMQLLACFSNAKSCFGLEPTKAMKIVVAQAENDDGDLAEMRDGIISGLNFSQREADRFCDNVLIHTTDGRQGLDFVQNVLRPIMEREHPDILVIDPLLAYIGGDASSQSVVGQFVRGWLEPLIREFDCAVILVHHISKPSKDKDVSRDALYTAFGSSEFDNAFRAQLVLEKTTEYGTYKLVAPKRDRHLRWRDDNGTPTNFKVITQSTKDGHICWYEVAPDALPEDALASPPSGRPPKDHWAVLCSTWNGEPSSRNQLISLICSSCSVSDRQSKRVFAELLSSGHIISTFPQTDPVTFIKVKP